MRDRPLLRRLSDRAAGALRRAEPAAAVRRDWLTGLADRGTVEAFVEDALAAAGDHGRVVAVLFVDLDDFKRVNDALGHAAGDELLRGVAAAISAQARAGDLVARQGGDEFVVVIPDLEAPARPVVHALAERILAAVAAPVAVGDLHLRVAASVGVALFPEHGAEAGELLDLADGAMYDAKAAGRNQIAYHRGAPADARTRGRAELALMAELPAAIEERRLVLHWQPIVDLRDGGVVGAEALVRWQHPVRGLLLPGAFVPAAERSGLMGALDGCVVDAFVRQRHAWRADGLDPYVGFNLSPQAAVRPGALGELLQRLRQGGLELDHVTVEMTESTALRDDEFLLEFVHGLVDAGITVCLDDFGRAYSSLSRLREVPSRWVKIDRSFLRDVPEDPAATKVLLAIMELLRALELHFVVEGIERDEQLALLRELDVGYGQGFLCGRPVPAAELEARLRTSAPSQLEPFAGPRVAEAAVEDVSSAT